MYGGKRSGQSPDFLCLIAYIYINTTTQHPWAPVVDWR